MRRRPGALVGGRPEAPFVRVTHGGRVLAECLEERLPRLVAEGACNARGHRTGQLQGVRGTRAEEPERRGHAPEETVARAELGRRDRLARAGAREAGERRRRREPAPLGMAGVVCGRVRLTVELYVR